MRRLTALLGILLLAATACGNDDDDKASTSNEDAAATSTTRSAQVEEYCGNILAIETAVEPDIDFESLTEAQQKEEVKKFFRTTLTPLVNKIKTGYKPPQIAADIDLQVATAEKVAQTGEFSEFETPTVQAAEERQHTFDRANCGWAPVDVTAVDFAFQGVPPTVKPGTTTFDLRNNGKELHEMIVLRRKPGVTLSFDDILKKEMKEAEKDVEDVASGFAAQGKTDYGIAKLTPGEYVMVCFIPGGTTSEDTEGKGPPHFQQGMKTEFKVA